MAEPNFKQPRIYDAAYLAYVRTMPCCVCGNDVAVEAHHPRVGSINDGIKAPGGAQKASDRWAVPLCGQCHRDLHTMSEGEYWASLGINPFTVAMLIRMPDE